MVAVGAGFLAVPRDGTVVTMLPSDGDRLMSQASRLRLLMMHLASPAVRARVPVDDLVQETFLRVLATGTLPEGDQDFSRYLVAVARHAVIDAVRALRAGKRSAPEVRLAHSDWSVAGVRASQLVQGTAGPATLVEQADADHQVRLAFASLETDHRRVIGFRQFQGLSAADTAPRMGRSETAVHSLYRRALAAWEVATRRRLGR